MLLKPIFNPSVFITLFLSFLLKNHGLLNQPICTVDSLSRPCLSRITAYLEVKVWSLPKYENLTTCKKYCGKEEKLLLRSNLISPLFHSIFNIYL